MGRGFAYLGVPPVFIGEMVLGLGLVAVLPRLEFRRVLGSPVVVLVLLFAAWGAFRTAPYLGVYGLDALRDAVLWGYAVFAIVVGALLLNTDRVEATLRLYRKLVPWIVVLVPMSVIVTRTIAEQLPRVPGSETALVMVKPGDAQVHLAGAAIFVLLGLHRVGLKSRPVWKEWFWWSLWLAGVVVGMAFNRGGMVALVTGMGLVVLLLPTRVWGHALLKPLTIAVMFLTVFFSFPVEFDVGHHRTISSRQIMRNVLSIVLPNQGDQLESTQEWREQWWSDIVDYTVQGPYFWTGKGFGVNLEVDDGYITTPDHSSRNPHSAHMDTLARTGVPGFVLWIALHLTFGVLMVRSYLRARADGLGDWARVDLWILGYWTAFLVNASFDTFLEGPMGGIWFWSLMGFGIAAIELQRRASQSKRGEERKARVFQPEPEARSRSRTLVPR